MLKVFEALQNEKTQKIAGVVGVTFTIIGAVGSVIGGALKEVKHDKILDEKVAKAVARAMEQAVEDK